MIGDVCMNHCHFVMALGQWLASGYPVPPPFEPGAGTSRVGKMEFGFRGASD